MGLGVVGAVLAAAILGFVATTGFPPGPSAVTSTTTSISSFAVTSTASTTYVLTTTVTVEFNASSSRLPSATTATSTASTTETTSIIITPASTTTSGTSPPLDIASANLTVRENGTFLAVEVVNQANYSVANCAISLSSVKLVVILELAAGSHSWIGIQVPKGLGVEAGQTYEVSLGVDSAISIQSSVEVAAASA